MSDISEIYNQFHDNLLSAREEYKEKLEEWSDILLECNDDYLNRYLHQFGNEFQDQMKRAEIRKMANQFFGQEEIPFVAIDGSCHKIDQEGFMSFYGGAYGSRGDITFDASTSNIKYQRWEFSKDVSMVAFLPLPPDQLDTSIDNEGMRKGQVFSDEEINELSSIHTKIMQLAEIYLAHEQATSGMDYPRLILMDNSLTGLLGHTSFSPDDIELTKGNFEGEKLSEFDLRVALSHPYNPGLGIPSKNEYQPWNNIFATAHRTGSRTVRRQQTGLDVESFNEAKRWIEKWDLSEETREDEVVLIKDPEVSWRKCQNVFESICEQLFIEKDISALMYDTETFEFLKPEDITFLRGVGLRKLIERCWRKNILLVGVAKDSSSKYFYRNFVGSLACDGKVDGYTQLPFSDRRILELLSYIISEDIKAPWGTLEFDACFTMLHPEPEDEDTPERPGDMTVQGYEIPGVGRVTRQERLFLRSIPIFLLEQESGLSSHAIFVDRLAYPSWDDSDSKDWTIEPDEIGKVSPLYYDDESGPADLQYLSQYLLSILVRNHFPEALGYPDPLHKADWGAKSMKRRVKKLMESGKTPMEADPLEKSMRDIREGFNR